MRHVAPHQLGELAAGRITGGQAKRLHAHVVGCERCRAVWERVREARSAMRDIAAASAPELRWDHVRAQVYWSASRTSVTVEPVRRRLWWLAAPALIGGAAIAALWGGASDDPLRPPPSSISVVAPRRPEVSEAATQLTPPLPVLAVPILLEGHVTARLAGSTPEMVEPERIGAAAFGVGATVHTAEGRFALQLGVDSTVTVAAGSELFLRRFDAAGIELVVDGQVDIELAARAPGQRFVVVAGDRTVEVRGTAFRVRHHDGDVAVACQHGRVAVSGGGTTIEIGAGEALEALNGAPLLRGSQRPLSAAELADLGAALVSPLPMWTDPETVLRTTGTMALEAPPTRAVRVDGIVVGTGVVWMRVPPGRHMVEAERSPGRYDPARWIEIGTTRDGPTMLTSAAPAASSDLIPTAARQQRRSELTAALDAGRLNTCVRMLAKHGISDGSSVELELRVERDGSLRFVNVVETNVTARVANCVRDAIASVHLGDGPAASWRHRVIF